MLEATPRGQEQFSPTSELPYFKIYAAGVFHRGQIQVEMRPPRKVPDDIVAKITEPICLGRDEKRKTYSLIRPPHVASGHLQLAIEESNFGTYMAVNNPVDRDKYGNLFAKPIATSTLIETADNQLVVIAQPNRLTASTGKGYFNVVGGFPDADINYEKGRIPDTNLYGEWDPFMTIQREVQEELGLWPGELDVQALGVVFNKHHISYQPIVPFIGRTLLTADEISRRDHESGIVPRFIEKDQAVIESLLLDYPAAHIPTGLANLLLYGKAVYGKAWYTDTADGMQDAHTVFTALDRQQKSQYVKDGMQHFYDLSRAA